MTYRSELYLIKSDNTEIPANIIANTLYLNKSYCEEEQLEIGGCIPSQFKCSVYGIEDITDIVKLKYIRYSNDEPDISFEGIIEELTSTSNDGIYNITAYDVLYNQNDISEWYNNYMANNQDVTISQLYNAVLEKLGLIGNSLSNYITYDFVIKQNILSNNITGTRLLKWICEALGVFGILDTYTSKNGTSYTTSTTFDLGVLGPRPVTAISPTSVFSGFQKSDYVCKKIDKVQIRSEEEDIGAIYGTGTNALIIEGNPLFYGMNASELEKCAKQISVNIKDNSDYTAYEAELNSESYLVRPLINPLLPISSSTSSIYSYIFNITWSGSQLTTCKIGANGVETRSEVLTSTNSEIIKLNYKTTSIVKNIDGIKTEVSSISSKTDKALTSIKQTDKYIENKVVKNDEVVAKINASQEGVSIKADKISLEGYTTINDNFKIDEKGNMEANNGKFSGEITSTSGTIGGWTISEGNLSVNIGGYEMVLNATDDSKPAMYILDKREGSTVMLPFFLEKDGSVRFTSISANEYRSIMCNDDIFLKLHQSDTYNGSVLGLFYSVEDIKNDLMGGGSNYFTFDSYGSEMTLPASKNTLIGAFSVKKSGWYLFKPEYRFVSLPTGRAVSVRVFEYTNLQYPVKGYQGSVTLVGAGIDYICMNGIQIFQAKANTKYYIYGYSAGGTATCDSLAWYNVYCLKTT